jgi:hypothetical protein
MACAYLLLTCYLKSTVVSSPPRRRVADTSVCGCSVQPSRSVAPPLVFSTGPCTRVEQNCSGTILDVTKISSGYHTGLTKLIQVSYWMSQFSRAGRIALLN